MRSSMFSHLPTDRGCLLLVAAFVTLLLLAGSGLALFVHWLLS